MFYFRIFIALGLTFTSMIYLELIIVYIARDKLKWIFFLGGGKIFQLFQYHLLRIVMFHTELPLEHFQT